MFADILVERVSVRFISSIKPIPETGVSEVAATQIPDNVSGNGSGNYHEGEEPPIQNPLPGKDTGEDDEPFTLNEHSQEDDCIRENRIGNNKIFDPGHRIYRVAM